MTEELDVVTGLSHLLVSQQTERDHHHQTGLLWLKLESEASLKLLKRTLGNMKKKFNLKKKRLNDIIKLSTI